MLCMEMKRILVTNKENVKVLYLPNILNGKILLKIVVVSLNFFPVYTCGHDNMLECLIRYGVGDKGFCDPFTNTCIGKSFH